jgi:hypothetical protein
MAFYTLESIFRNIQTRANSFLSAFSSARASLAKRLDDFMNPAIPVTLPSVVDPAKLKMRNQLIKDLLDPKKTKTDIKNVAKLKKILKEIFALRSHSNTTQKDLDKMIKQFNEKYTAFRKQIKKTADWTKPNIKQELRQLAIEAVLYSDAVLARLEQDLRDAKKPGTTESVSKSLANQSTDYGRNFMYSGIINLYSHARGRTTPMGQFVTINIDKKYGAKFYEADSHEGFLRKIYNTFIKDGFYQNYGNKAFKEQLLKSMPDGDQRFEHWTHKDSKKTKTFRPFPDTRPT